jgi:ATP-dependent NAD(P)H-hydrate dehydratase
VTCAKSKNIPIVIDADGLFILSYDVSLVSGYKKCLLTPNFMEFKRLYDETFKEELQQETSSEYDETKQFKSVQAQSEAVRHLAARLNNVTILKKGQVDIISNGVEVVTNDVQGSLKRCGGIGDILTGTLGSFAYWTHAAMPDNSDPHKQPGILAAYAASTLVKECSKQAFEKFHRSLLAVDVIEQIPQQVYRLFDQND